jgi:hypothetical protein
LTRFGVGKTSRKGRGGADRFERTQLVFREGARVGPRAQQGALAGIGVANDGDYGQVARRDLIHLLNRTPEQVD